MNSASWRLEVSPSARRDLDCLPEKAAAAAAETFDAILRDPYRIGKPLRFELEGRWTARRGPYRVIYRIDEEDHVIRVLRIAHRADVYRRR